MLATHTVKISSPFTVLASRDLYATTRILLPDEAKSVPAIQIGDRYYSFFRATKSAQDAFALTTRLCDRNNPVAIVKTPKGYSLWVEEPDAMPQDLMNQITIPLMPAVSRILPSTSPQCQPVNFRVPDLDSPMPGILYEGQYYSIFRKEPNMDMVLDILSQLAQRNDPAIVVPEGTGCIVCILEPEALPV